MNLLLNLDWDNWLYGIGAGFIGGGSGAVTGGITLSVIDGNDFNIYTRKLYVTMAALFISNGLMSMFLFLKQNPLPAIKTTTTIKKTETGTDSTTVTKVEQVKTESPVVQMGDKK